MDIDLDDLISSDIGNQTKVNAKFKPKPKPKPKPNTKTQPEPKPTSTPSTQFVESAARTEEEQPGNDVNKNFRNEIDDWKRKTSFGKPQEDNVDTVLTLESLNDPLPQSAPVTANSSPSSDTPAVSVSMHGNLEKGPIEHDVNNKINAGTNLEKFPEIDPLTGSEAAIYNDYEDVMTGNLSPGLKDAESLEPIDNLSQPVSHSGPKVGKFKPLPRAQTRKVEQIATIPNQEVLSFQDEEFIHTVSSQTDYMDDEPGPLFTADEILGSSSITVTDSMETAIDDFHVKKEAINLEEVPQLESEIPAENLDVVPEIPSMSPENVKRGKRKTRKASSPTQQDQSAEPSLENQAGRCPKRVRKRTYKALQLIDEPEEEGINDDFVHENEDNINDADHENKLGSERNGSKSKKQVTEKIKPVRKLIRASESEVPVESTKVVKKKFPHRTRRNKRQVNPELLKIPEDELEFHMHNVPMKELIRLAEHRERLARKEASTSGTPAMNQSASSISNHNDDDEAFTHGTGSDNEHDYSTVEDNATYYNYRTHMKIAPRIKWSKQDTELFYEAIQQFGTDLSMIKECFPGRTREQIKSKFKKEERQQPLRLNDALTTRFKGNTHFEDVIERLKQAQAQESEDDESMNMMDEEAVTADINVEAADATKPMEPDVQETVGSPSKSHDSEDDMFRFSQYRSEI